MSIKLKDTISDLINKANKDGSYGILSYLTSSNGWTGVSNSEMIVLGTVAHKLTIRTSSDNLYHYNSNKSTSYKILDSNNTYISGNTVYINGSSVSNTDSSVYQSETTTTSYRAIAMGATTSSATGSSMTGATTGQIYLSNNLYFQPSTGSLFTKSLYITGGGSTTNGITSDETANIYFSINNNVPLVINNTEKIN